MRLTKCCFLAFIFLALGPGISLSQEKPLTRFGVALDSKQFPQSSPKELRQSLLVALESKRLDYLIAHLVVPSYVDEKVAQVYNGRFEGQFEETKSRLENTPLRAEFEKLLKDGKMEQSGNNAFVRLESLPEREVHFSLIGGKWYLLNGNSPDRPNPRRK